MIELWRISIVVAGAVCFALLAIGRVPPRDTHEAILTSLRAIDINHASLQRDVLQARSGLLKNYDPLVDSVVGLHAAVSDLERLFPESGVENPSSLELELRKLTATINGDERLVEGFKTENAILQNSLSIANEMLSELHMSTNPLVVRALGTSSDLGNLMMRFAAAPEDRFAAVIRGRLTAMKSVASGIPTVDSFAAHTAIILKTLPSVDNTIELIQSSGTSSEAQILQKKYLDAYGVISTRSAWSRLMLGSISVFLCVYIAVLIYRLRAQAYRLKQQLDFENLATSIKKRFDEDLENIGAAMSASLSTAAQFFDASDYAFAVINIETRELEQIFASAGNTEFQALIDRFAHEQCGSLIKAEQPWGQFHYHNLQQSEIRAFPEGSLSAGSITAASIDPKTIGLLLLEHREVRTKPSSDEIRLLVNTVVVLAQNLRIHKERLEKDALEARLEHSQRLEAVGTLAGGIAHEFNNALGAILGYGEMALQINHTPSRARQYVREILASGERAKLIIDQILTFSRKPERVTRPFDPKEAIDHIIPLVKLSIPETVTLIAEIPDMLPVVFGNPIEFQQVIMNLCMNAAQASRENGQIDVTTKRVDVKSKMLLSHGELLPGGYLLVEVSDKGTGISQSVLPHIFEPFFTTKSKIGGTGLGLAVVHGYVTGMSGKIDVKSEPDNYTHFGLYFPISSQAPIPLAQFFAEAQTPLGNGEIVVIAERDSGLRLMHEEKIAALGYEPVGFSDLTTMRTWLAKGEIKPDLIMLDLDLWKSPPNLTEMVKEFKPIATLLLTDQEKDGVDPRVSAGIARLRKPVSSNSLATTLYTMIGSRSRPLAGAARNGDA
jgi:signal transduction histidine kinase